MKPGPDLMVNLGSPEPRSAVKITPLEAMSLANFTSVWCRPNPRAA